MLWSEIKYLCRHSPLHSSWCLMRGGGQQLSSQTADDTSGEISSSAIRNHQPHNGTFYFSVSTTTTTTTTTNHYTEYWDWRGIITQRYLHSLSPAARSPLWGYSGQWGSTGGRELPFIIKYHYLPNKIPPGISSDQANKTDFIKFYWFFIQLMREI